MFQCTRVCVRVRVYDIRLCLYLQNYANTQARICAGACVCMCVFVCVCVSLSLFLSLSLCACMCVYLGRTAVEGL